MSSRNCCWLEHSKELDKRSILWKASSCPLPAARGVKVPFEGTAWPSPGPRASFGVASSLTLEEQVEVETHISSSVSGWITLSYHRQPWRQHYIEAQSAIKGDFVPSFPSDQCAASTPGPHSSLCVGWWSASVGNLRLLLYFPQQKMEQTQLHQTPNFILKNDNFLFPLFRS